MPHASTEAENIAAKAYRFGLATFVVTVVALIPMGICLVYHPPSNPVSKF
jgi:hypothetical protein